MPCMDLPVPAGGAEAGPDLELSRIILAHDLLFSKLHCLYIL